jgi:hypothetical protein
MTTTTGGGTHVECRELEDDGATSDTVAGGVAVDFVHTGGVSVAVAVVGADVGAGARGGSGVGVGAGVGVVTVVGVGVGVGVEVEDCKLVRIAVKSCTSCFCSNSS